MRKGLREFLTFVAVLVVVFGGLYLYAGIWPPAVIVESSSMMHDERDTTFGRIGTIDPGDITLVHSVKDASDIETLVESARNRYGEPGDVVVYFPANDRSSTPIIHRAIAYVEPSGSGYRVRWSASASCVGGAHKDPADTRWCVYGSTGVTLPQIEMQDYRPDQAGFITKGDNPVTNRVADVIVGISHDASGRPSIVHPAWIEGKARAEVPWIGLVKLALSGHPNERDPPPSYVNIGWAYAPRDLWICLAISLVVLVGGPIAWDVIASRRVKRDR